MSRVLHGIMAISLVLTFTAGSSEANHRRGSCYCCCSPCAAPAPAQFVERQVTCYRSQLVEQTVTVPVTRCVPVQETYTYTVNMPVTKQVKQLQTVYVEQQKEVTVPVTTCETVTFNETRTITEYTPTTKEIEYLHTTFVPECIDRKVLANNVQQIRKCATFATPLGPTCTGCGHGDLCNPAPGPVALYNSYCIDFLVETQEVTIKQTVLKPVTETRKTTVCEMVASKKEVTVPVCKTVTKTENVKKIVCEKVPVQKEVVVTVCENVAQQQTGTRTVYRTVTENVTHKVTTCQQVPYTITVRVPVAAPGGCCQ